MSLRLLNRTRMHKLEYSSASLYDFLKRYFVTVFRPDSHDDADRPPFLNWDVFGQLKERGIDYLLQMNPVLCHQPKKIENPYRRTDPPNSASF